MQTSATMVDGYRGVAAKRSAAVSAALLCLLLLMVLDLALGPSGMPLGDVWAALLAGPDGADRTSAAILWQIRLPQTLMGAIVGICLGLAGLQMQTILDNPLASPFTLGFSAAAGFGAALALMFGSALPLPEIFATPLAAFAMTLVATLLVYSVARLQGAAPEILVLAGIAVLFFFQALQSLLQFLASPEVLQQIVFWLFGSLLKATWTSVAVSGLILAACLPFLASNCWKLTALRLGDTAAASLGLDVERLRKHSFILVALLTAAAVCFVGTVGFVGLIAPHFARMMVGEDHRFALPAAAVSGGVILIAASVFGKAISPGAAIPVGIITAVAGVPMLFAVIVQRGRRGRS
jgi:iron complex transport system permease protein